MKKELHKVSCRNYFTKSRIESHSGIWSKMLLPQCHKPNHGIWTSGRTIIIETGRVVGCDLG